MAEASEGVAPPGNAEEKSKTEFLNRVKKVKSEIKTKFQKVRKELDDQELNILKRVEDIEQEILENYERASISLKEITQAREYLLRTFKSNATNTLLKKNLEMFDKEIEDIKQDSKIDSTIELVWKMEKLEISSDVCGVSMNTNTTDVPQLPPNPELLDRNAGNYPFDYIREPNASQFPPNSGFSDRRYRVEQVATSKLSCDSGIPKTPKPGESGSMGGVPSFSQYEKLGIHSQTPRGSPSGSTGQNQARTSQGLPPIEEGNQGRKYNQPQQTPVDAQSSASMGENKGKPMIPPPTKVIDDRFQTLAFTHGDSQGLYETQPSLPPRKLPDSGKQMEENVYANKDEIIQHEQNRAPATQAYPPGDMGQRNMDHGFENQHYVDQRGQYHQGSMNRDHFSGPQQTPMSQHYTGDIGQTGGSRGFDKGPQEKGSFHEQGNMGRASQFSGPQQTPMSQHYTGDIDQTGGSRGFDKGPKEKGPFHEQGITGRASQYSGPQQTPMSQHYTGDIDQRSVDRGFERPQDQSPYYPGNMADQQPFIDEST